MTGSRPSAQAILAPPPLEVAAAPDPRDDATLLLSGRQLLLARAVWGALAVFLLAFFLANLPIYFAQLRTVCLGSHCLLWQLTPEHARALQHSQLSPTAYALVTVIFSAMTVLVWFACAGLVVWHHSRRWLALLACLMLMAQSVTQMGGWGVAPMSYSGPVGHLLAVAVAVLAVTVFLLVFALFPSGRFVPGWMRWGIIALVPAVGWAYVSVVPSQVPITRVVNPLGLAVVATGTAAIIAAQIYRFRRVSTPVERQQTKWVVLAVLVLIPLNLLYYLLPVVVPALARPASLYFLLARPLYNVLYLLAPISIGIAILRYHLWEVDAVIRRWLVYGTLTTVLAAVYVGVVLGAQAVIQALSGQAGQHPVVLVASTLLVAALFTPVRRGLQTTIDRRFYRSKYDAAKTLEAFSATLANQVDLEQVREAILTTVQQTMEPTQVDLWLATPSAPSRQGVETASGMDRP
jgi:hypothetical protein